MSWRLELQKSWTMVGFTLDMLKDMDPRTWPELSLEWKDEVETMEKYDWDGFTKQYSALIT